MKAAVYTEYGPPHVFQLKDVEQPTPKKNEIRVKIYAASATTGDCRLRSLNVPFEFKWILQLWQGIRRPKRTILGNEFAGIVESIGSDVTQFQVGDSVFGVNQFGTYAEYVCIAEDHAVCLKPQNMSYEEAATLSFGATTALVGLVENGQLKKGQCVLINGASGAIGTSAIQIAKSLGAEVVGVCSGKNVELVRSLGADHVIDYTQDDFSKQGRQYDVILDTVGNLSFAQCKKVLTSKGKLFLAVARLPQYLQMAWTALFSSQKVICFVALGTKQTHLQLKELVEHHTLRSWIDRSYALADIAEAHRYVETGRKRGNIAITIYTEPSV